MSAKRVKRSKNTRLTSSAGARRTTITSGGSPSVSVPIEFMTVTHEAYHHVLSDIYDYFDSRVDWLGHLSAIITLVFGASVDGIASHILGMDLNSETTVMELIDGMRIYLVLLVASLVCYAFIFYLHYRCKAKEKDDFFRRFENVDQLNRIQYITSVSVASDSAENEKHSSSLEERE